LDEVIPFQIASTLYEGRRGFTVLLLLRG